MVGCYKIYEYWKDKGITESGEISDTDGISIVENPYKPSCFACGKLVHPRELLSWEPYRREIKEVWDDKNVNHKLQKCHIFAKQFGGSDTPDNLFLMCEDCHAESPDTQNRNAFFRWVYRKRKETCHGFHWKRMLEETAAEIRSRGYEPIEFLRHFNVAEMTEITDKALKQCGTHGTAIAESSVVVCLVDALEKRFFEIRGEELNRG